MIVIHPNDKSTSFLSQMYSGKKDITFIDETWNNRNIRETIGISPHDEIIMMLGHGCGTGLFAPYGNDQFARTIVDSRLVYLLREHKCIGIWCNADEFAKKYELKGLFSGMIISEPEEAYNLGIDIYGEDLDICNNQFANDLDYCIRHYSLDLVPKIMKEVQDYHSALKDFNYNNLFYY